MILWIVLPLAGALIGWWTNHLALWMLFHPYQPLRLPGWTWQGVIPRRREQLAEGLSQALEEHLLTLEDRQALLDAVEIEEHIDKVVSQVLQQQVPRGVFQRVPALEGLRERIIEMLRVQIMKKMPTRLSEIDENILVKVAAEMDLAGHVHKRLLEMPLEELETLIRRTAKNEFRGIEIAGACIGFLLGLLQVGCVILLKHLGL